MAKIDNTYTVYYDTVSKELQGQGTWGEKDGTPDSDGICQLKGLQVSFASSVTVYHTDTYSDAETYIEDNNLNFPE